MAKNFKILFVFILIGLLSYGFILFRQPAVSVIIPVYNSEKYLEKCLDSIFAQSGRFEVIVVNDGSTDQSLAILNSYEKKYSNLKIITQENQGIGAARNTAMRHAKGKYLTFVDSDDWIEPDTFLLSLKAIKKDNPDILLTSFYDVYDQEWVRKAEGNIAAEQMLEPYKKRSTSLDKLVLISPFYGLEGGKELFYGTGYVRACFFKRSFIEKYNLTFPDGIAEDVVFLYKTYLHNPLITILNTPLYNYHNRIDSVSKNPRIFEDGRKSLKLMQQTDEYIKANRYIQMIIDDSWLFLVILGFSNSTRYHTDISQYSSLINEAYHSFDKYSEAEKKNCRYYQQLKKMLQH
jgi:glycosyltransferase EpsH